MISNKSTRTSIFSLVLILAFFALRMYFMDSEDFESLSNPPDQAELILNTNQLDIGRVDYVIDGDTAWIIIDGKKVKVRFIGVDTPERGEIGYEEASAYTRNLIDHQMVYLESDVSDKDQYGRLLRYIWLDEPDMYDSPISLSYAIIGEHMLNARLLKAGHADVMTYAPNDKYEEVFRYFKDREEQE